MRSSLSMTVGVARWLACTIVVLLALFFEAQAATAFPTAELRVYPSATPPSSAPGGSDVTYTIRIQNNGPQDANHMVAHITLANTVTWRVSTYTNPGPPSRTENCSHVPNGDGRGGTVDCPIGTLFVSPTALATVVLRITLPTVTFATIITEIGTVTIDERVQVGSDARSSSFNLSTEALPIPALSLTMTPSPPTPILAGSRLTYTITVGNSGGTATGVRMTDTLPRNVRYTSASFTIGGSAPTVCPWSDGPPRATCEIGTLTHDGTAIVTLVVTAFEAGSATNTADVIATEAPIPVTQQVTTVVLPAANLVVTKLGNPRVSVQLGTDLTYTITVLNGGPSPATGVTVTDTLPSSVMFRSGDSRCTYAGGTLKGGTLVGGTVTCTIGSMARLAVERITITVRPTVVEPIRNEVTVRGNEADPEPSNTFALTIPVLGADLSVSQTGSAAGGLISSMTFSMTVTNSGPVGATNVALTDRLPLSIPLLPTSGSPTLVATASQGSCASGTPGVFTVNSYNVLTCAIGNLNPGSSATVTVVISRVPAGSYRNAATVTGTPGDHNLTNNTSATSVTVPSTPLPGAPTPPTPPLPHP